MITGYKSPLVDLNDALSSVCATPCRSLAVSFEDLKNSSDDAKQTIFNDFSVL
jgi:hypothetical protein